MRPSGSSLLRGVVAALLGGTAGLLATYAHESAAHGHPTGAGHRIVTVALGALAVVAADLAGWRLVTLADSAAEYFQSPWSQSAARIGAYLLLAGVFMAFLFLLGAVLGLT